MTDTYDLHVEARRDDIIVTMPGTTYRVVYLKRHREPKLIAKLNYSRRAEGTDYAGRIRCSRLEADNDAGESGWLLQPVRGHFLRYGHWCIMRRRASPFRIAATERAISIFACARSPST